MRLIQGRQSVNAFALCIELATDQSDAGNQVQPHEKHDHRAEAAVKDVVVRDMSHVPGEAGRSKQPQDSREHCAGPNSEEAGARCAFHAFQFRPVIRTEVVQQPRDKGGGAERQPVTSKAP